MRRCLFPLALAVAAAGLVGCFFQSPPAAPPSLGDPPPSTAVKPAGADLASADDKEAVVRGGNAFAFDLYAKVHGADNAFFSPASISTALAMTFAGARGETAKQMAKALHFPREDKRLHHAFASLLWDLQGGGKPRAARVNIANSLWGSGGLQPDFLQVMKDDYGAGQHQANYADPKGASKTINDWVEEQTNHKIKDLLHDGDVTEDTILVLVNAIYFKGDWQYQFKKESTRDGPFHSGPGKNLTAPMMSQTAHFGYYDDVVHSRDRDKDKGGDKSDKDNPGTFQMLEMPYRGGDLAMAVLLPRDPDGLPALERALTAEKLAGWVGALHSAEVDVTLPRFTMTSRFDLGGALAGLGMPLAFQEGGADLSGLTGRKGPYISKVIHQAFVDVNEEGAEAAAATAVIVNDKEAGPPPERYEFRADHPFLFLIRDVRSGAILFLGRVANPAA